MNPIPALRITYQLTEQDLIQFSLYLVTHSPHLKRMNRSMGWFFLVIPISFLIAPPYVEGIFSHKIKLALGLVVFNAVLHYATSPSSKLNKRLMRSAIKKTMHYHITPGQIGTHSLEIDENGFTDATEYSRHQYAWGTLLRVETEADYTYLHTSDSTAVIIPHQALEKEALVSLLNSIASHYHPEKRISSP